MNLSERLRIIIERVTPSTRRFAALEEATKINAKTWQTWWSRGGKASPDMIQAVGKIWPHFAFWLVTGVTDEDHGHTKPDWVWHAFPKPKPQREQATKLFSTLIEIDEYSEQHGPDVEIPEQLKEKERYLRRIREAEERLLSELQERKNQKNLEKESPEDNNP